MISSTAQRGLIPLPDWELDNKVGGAALTAFGVFMAVLTSLHVSQWGVDAEAVHLYALSTLFVVGGLYVYLMKPYAGVVFAILPWIAVVVIFFLLIARGIAGGQPKEGIQIADLLFPGMGITAIISWLAGGVNLIDYLRDLR